jgi:hypothetical protein
VARQIGGGAEFEGKENEWVFEAEDHIRKVIAKLLVEQAKLLREVKRLEGENKRLKRAK